MKLQQSAGKVIPLTRATGFEKQFTPCIDFLYRFACRLTHNRDDAEDLVQQLAVNLLSRQEDLAAKDNLKAWLGKCLYNLFVSEYRKKSRLRLLRYTDADQEMVEDTAPGPAQRAEADSVGNQVHHALSRLNREQREVLLLSDAEEIPLPHLAVMFGIPLGTLKSRLHRARLALRDMLVPGGDDTAGAFICRYRNRRRFSPANPRWCRRR